MININKYLGWLLLLLCMFPWSSPLPMASDTQPLAFFLALIYFIINVRELNIYLLPAVFMLIGALFSFLISDFNDGLRGMFGYISMLVVSSALLHHFKTHGMPKYKFYQGVIVTWGVVGLIQFWFPSIVSFLSSRDGIYALSGGRGVNSFAPEPTFYGMFLVIVLFTVYVQASKNKHFATPKQISLLYIIILGQILFLSRSSLVILFLIISLVLYGLIFKPFFAVSFIAILVWSIIISAMFFSYDFTDDLAISFRLFKLFIELKNAGISDILLIDGSVSDRVVQIISSHYIAISNWLVPQGFSTWAKQADALPPFIEGSYNSIGGLNRVLSFSGSLLYEAGFFALPFLVVFIYLIALTTPGRGLRKVSFKVIISTIFILQTIPLGLSSISFVFAILVSNIKNDITRQKNFYQHTALSN
jgi:hypothetical protein